MSRAYPIDAKIFTWDCPTEYGGDFSPRDAEIAFAKEFPETCWHLKLNGGNFAVLPLVSFQESHKTVSRCLVAASSVTERACRLCRGRVLQLLPNRGRLLPRQIALYSVAEEAVRQATTEDNGGNFWCYALVEGGLYSLVFCEGRLVYWSEERGVGGESASLEAYLRRIRCFLKTDVLFSRIGHFAEMELQFRFDRRNFKKSARNPFWKEVNLRGVRRSSHLEVPWKMLGTVLLLCLALLYELWVYREKDSLSCKDCVEAAPVELLPAPETLESAEPVEKDYVEKLFAEESAAVRKKCSLPDFRLNGVVGEKLAMFTVAAESRVASPGDSIGDFVVESIRRAGVRLVCGDSVVVRGVGDE